MSQDPFADFSDTPQAKTQRDQNRRRQTRRLFGKRVLLILAAVVGASVGAALAALTSAGGTRNLVPYVFYAALVGVVGAGCSLVFAMWRLIRESLDHEFHGTTEETNPGRMMFVIVTVCTVVAASVGAATGADVAGENFEAKQIAFVCAAAGSSLVLLPALVIWILGRAKSKRRMWESPAGSPTDSDGFRRGGRNNSSS